MKRLSADELRQSHEVLRFDFVRVELDLAITFCEIALSAETETKARRNTTHARRAYSSAMRFLEGASLTNLMGLEINQRIERLGAMLESLDRG